jgi:hypothetical protein
MDAWFFLSFPRCDTSRIAGPEGAKNLAGQKCPPPDSNPFNGVEFGKNLARLSRQFATGANRRFAMWTTIPREGIRVVSDAGAANVREWYVSRSRHFIGVHNEAPGVAVSSRKLYDL